MKDVGPVNESVDVHHLVVETKIAHLIGYLFPVQEVTLPNLALVMTVFVEAN